MRRTATLPILLIAGALALTGCTPEAAPTPTPTPTQTAAFSSLEEAQAAAEEAYGNYFNTALQISRDGGLDPERLQPLVSDQIWRTDRDGFNDMASAGIRLEGEGNYRVEVQRFSQAEVVIYACDDFRNIRVVDAAGADVTPPERDEKFAYEVTFDPQASFRMVSKNLWTGGGVC